MFSKAENSPSQWYFNMGAIPLNPIFINVAVVKQCCDNLTSDVRKLLLSSASLLLRDLFQLTMRLEIWREWRISSVE